MEKTISVFEDIPHYVNSHLYFNPIIKQLRKKQEKQNGESEKELNELLDNILLYPELSAQIKDLNIVCRHAKLLGNMLQMYFPTTSQETGFYAIALPFVSDITQSGTHCKSSFLTAVGERYFIAEEDGKAFLQAKLKIAYQFVLHTFYGFSLPQDNTCVVPVIDAVTGGKKVIEFELLPDFLEVTTSADLPQIEELRLSQIARKIGNNTFSWEDLSLLQFVFNGVLLVKARDVTIRETIGKIKNILFAMPYFGDLKLFDSLQHQMQKLTGLSESRISITSMIEINKGETDAAVSDQYKFLSQPVFFTAQDSSLWKEIKEALEKRSFLLITDLSDAFLQKYSFLQFSREAKIKSLLICPLKFGEELMGILSITCLDEARLTHEHLMKIEPVVPLFELALGKQSKKMDDEVDKVVKEQFTAVQSSVNWKFTETARNFIVKKNNGEDTKIESIVFDNVFPLYGSIDIRNSSIERSSAMQKDLLDQLELANDVIRKSKGKIHLYSLQEISYRIEKYISVASIVLFPGDELAIQNFLDEEIAELFNHLKIAVPEVSDDINNYFLLLNANTRKISRQCAAFEQSIAMVNNELVKFIDQEQVKVQEIYAHYFEYFVTDGVDFNIYIGQSITPEKPFDQFYLKNLKLWQLTTLVLAAQKVKKLHETMPVRLDTTQLILAHNKPLSISFRTAERKFDVDGAYNIHYEIIKKRIDKIKILDSCERLTQPGKIAIVYAHNKEAQEYAAYIEFLQMEGLLEGNIEHHDLEDLPGVRGLKALRVSIRMAKAEEACPSIISKYQLPVAG